MAITCHRSTTLRLLWLLAALVLIAVPATVGAKQFSAWGAPQPVTEINAAGIADGCPIESPDGLSIYFASLRSPNLSYPDTPKNDIWVAHRTSVDAAWSAPQALPVPVNSTAADFCPTPLSGKRLLFVSDRGSQQGVCGAGDIYMTRLNPEHGWEEPINLGCDPFGPNSAGGEFSPSIFETATGTFLYYSRPGSVGGQDIYVSQQRADGTFGPGSLVGGLNTAFADQMPNVSRDGLEIVFVSNRAGGSLDIHTAHRATTSDPWSDPMPLPYPINTSIDESRPSLSGDGERLHFGRAGDIYVSERTKVTGSD